MVEGRKNILFWSLILILLSVFVFGILIWDRYNLFKVEKKKAEEIEYIVLNQEEKKLSRNDLENLSLEEKNDVIYLMNNYFTDVFNAHSDNYCGVVNEKETLIVDRTDEYTRVVSYDNYKDMEKHLKSIVSESYISKNLKKSFAQNNDKLYCMEDNDESLNYVNDSFKLEGFLKEKNNVKIVGNYNATNEENKKYNYRVYATLTTNNNNYVVNTYEEY